MVSFSYTQDFGRLCESEVQLSLKFGVREKVTPVTPRNDSCHQYFVALSEFIVEEDADVRVQLFLSREEAVSASTEGTTQLSALCNFEVNWLYTEYFDEVSRGLGLQRLIQTCRSGFDGDFCAGG